MTSGAIDEAKNPILRDDWPAARWPGVAFPLRWLETAIYWAAGISILSGQSFRWIDLRMAGPLAQPLLVLWLLSLVGLGVSRCVDIPAGRAITQTQVRRRVWLNQFFLIPSWMILLVLLQNTLRYYHLLHQRNGDLQIGPPMCLLVLLAMAVWLGSDPSRVFTAPPKLLPPPEKRQRLLRHTRFDMGFGFIFVLLMVWVFAFEFHANPPPPNMRVDLGVVLGHAVLPGDVSDRSMRNRTLAGVALFKTHRIRYLMLSGSAPDGATSPHRNQADAMLKIALAHGVPRDRIILDFYGDNTRFTAYNTRRVMQKMGFKTVVAISSDYHLPRTALAFAQLGIHAWTVPDVNHQWRQTDPFAMLREWVAYGVYYFDRNYHHPKNQP